MPTNETDQAGIDRRGHDRRKMQAPSLPSSERRKDQRRSGLDRRTQPRSTD